MSRTNLISNSVNLIKATKNLLTGKMIRGLVGYYDRRYPPTKFLKWNLPKINIQCIMSGYPRSGTNWIRNVIEKSSGTKTFTIAGDEITPATKDVCLIKIHARSKWIARAKALWLLPPHNFGGKYIYVYRDPRDAIISLYEMYRRRKGIADLQPKDFIKLYDPIRQYRWEINAWVFGNHEDVLLIRFEDLKMRPVAIFEKIFGYLNIDTPVDPRCIGQLVLVADLEKRPRAAVYGWKKAPPKYQCIIDSVNKELDKEIKLLGYEAYTP